MKAKDCQTKQDVRTQITRIDQELTKLLAKRHAYVIRMAEIKKDVAEVRDEARIQVVIDQVRGWAEKDHLPPDQAELIWRALIDYNIALEKHLINARNNEQ